MKNRIMMLLALGACLGLLMSACPKGKKEGKKEKGKPEPGPTAMAPKPAMGPPLPDPRRRIVPPPRLNLKPQTFAMEKLSITMPVPLGWKAEYVKATKLHKLTSPKVAGVVIWIGETCNGKCATVAANVTGAAKIIAKAAGKDRVVLDKALKGGGQEVISVQKSGGKFYAYHHVFKFQKGWGIAALCRLVTSFAKPAGEAKAIHLLMQYAATCRELTASPKGAAKPTKPPAKK